MKLKLTPRAEREADRIDAWWRARRASAGDLFLTELEVAMALVLTSPGVGAPYGTHEGALVQRVLLPRTQHHIYYVIEGELIGVVSIWSALRRRGPRFPRGDLP